MKLLRVARVSREYTSVARRKVARPSTQHGNSVSRVVAFSFEERDASRYRLCRRISSIAFRRYRQNAPRKKI